MAENHVNGRRGIYLGWCPLVRVEHIFIFFEGVVVVLVVIGDPGRLSSREANLCLVRGKITGRL